jgi:hypothetical protein
MIARDTEVKFRDRLLFTVFSVAASGRYVRYAYSLLRCTQTPPAGPVYLPSSSLPRGDWRSEQNTKKILYSRCYHR